MQKMVVYSRWEGEAIKIILAVLLYAFPLFVGSVFRLKTVSATYLMGQLLMWAVFQLFAVPMIQLRTSFTALFWAYTVAVVGLSILGIWRRKGIRFQKPEITVYLILAVIVIAYQASKYIFGMHLDEDDARWLAEANDAIVKDRMLLHNPATGEYIGRFVGEMVKDVYSPWPFYLGWQARFTGMRVAVIAHTVYPPVLLALSYCAYYHMGRLLFKGKTEQGIFLLMVSVINLFFAGNRYTISVRVLTRIWQGKQTVAAVPIPAILMLILKIQDEDTVRNWLLLGITGCAASLMSGMGIAISLIMIGVYGGYVVVCRRWKRIPLWLLSMLPSLACGAGYYFLRG